MTYINSRTGWDVTQQDFSRKRSISYPKVVSVLALTVAIGIAGYLGISTLQQMSADLNTKLAAVPAAAASIHHGADALRTRADAVAASGVPIATANLPEAQRAELTAAGAARVVPCSVVGGPDLAAVAEVLEISCGVR